MMNNYILYILVMAGVTYLIRMLPMTLLKRKIKSPLFQSFIYYVPYAVLSAMTIPAILYSTSNVIPSVLGFASAVAAAFFGRSLLTVSLTACVSALVCELLVTLI